MAYTKTEYERAWQTLFPGSPSPYSLEGIQAALLRRCPHPPLQINEAGVCADCGLPAFADPRLLAAAPRMLQLLQEISVPESFPLWDADRRALLRELEGER